MTAPEGGELGRALRLEVPITFSPEALDGIDESAAVIAEPARKLRTTHWDTPDLRLARWGVSLEYSADSGWVLRLPSTSEGMAAPDGAELRFDGAADRPPDQALHLVRVYARHAPVELVARLVTVTVETALLDLVGTVLARLVDDTVSVYSGPRVTQRFREIALFSDQRWPTAGSDRHRGTRRPEPSPRGHGRWSRERSGWSDHPRRRSARSPSAVRRPPGDVVRRALSTSVIRLLRHDPGVRLGIDAEDVHQARVATRRLRSDLRTFQPLLDRDLGRRACAMTSAGSAASSGAFATPRCSAIASAPRRPRSRPSTGGRRRR